MLPATQAKRRRLYEGFTATDTVIGGLYGALTSVDLSEEKG